MATRSAENTTVAAEHAGGCLKILPKEVLSPIVTIAKKTKKVAKEDPRRVIHSLKVALALAVVSMFYYFQTLSHGFGDNAMWAVLTVVVVFEFSVGATLGKGLNRMLATLLAGALGVATHSLAIVCGNKGEPVLISFFVFVTAATVTFMRFFPEFKTRYDYGLNIFILTFSLVSVSGYRQEEVLNMAHQRLSTVMIGSCIVIIICIFIYPIWIGEDLHNEVADNMEKLGNFFEVFGDEYFNVLDSEDRPITDDKSLLEGYKSVLNSKTNEENMANLAKWEPCHGQFRFRHPWKQYLKVGTLTRQCAYKIDTLNVYIQSEQLNLQTPYQWRVRIRDPCTNISSESGRALKSLSLSIKTMTQSSIFKTHISNAKGAAESLRSLLGVNPWEGAELIDIVPAAAVASLLLDVVICIEKISEAVDELASLAHFKNFHIAVTPESPHIVFYRGAVQSISAADASHHVITVDGSTTDLAEGGGDSSHRDEVDDSSHR